MWGLKFETIEHFFYLYNFAREGGEKRVRAQFDVGVYNFIRVRCIACVASIYKAFLNPPFLNS